MGGTERRQQHYDPLFAEKLKDESLRAASDGPDGFGKRLRKLREKKRISRRVLADFVQTSKNSISRYERGERMPDIVTASRIADYFEVSLDWLVGYEDFE